MRRTLLIIAASIVIIGIGVFVYFYFFAGTPNITVAPGTTTFPSAGHGTQGTPDDSVIATTSIPVAISARLVQISKGPVATGIIVVDVPTENASSSPETTVKYIERQSGNVYSYTVGTGTITRTSNKTLPSIQSATWLPDASIAFVQYLSGDNFSTINTYALPADSSSEQGFFLSQNLMDISVSSTSILTLASGVNGSVASVSHTDGTGVNEVFSTPLSSLRVSLAGKNQYLAYTKPSASIPGYVFVVDDAGLFSRVAGPANGLTALASHSGKYVLVSYAVGNTLRTKLIILDTNESIDLPIATLSDKCVWTTDDSAIYCGVPINPSTSYAYPDNWYQGAVLFSDRIWKIDVAGRYAQLVLDFPKETAKTLDISSISINPSATELSFINKSDDSLWAYAL